MQEDKMLIVMEGGFIQYRDGAKGSVELYDFQVEETFQGKGVGTQLLKKMEESIGKGRMVYLFTRTENEKAQRFYEKRGYQKACVIEDFYSDNLSPIWGMRSGNAIMYIKHL